MKEKRKALWRTGWLLLVSFVIWTALVMTVDVQPAGETGTKIGFALLNSRFHAFTGVHMQIYILTDWLGLVPVLVCLCFGCVGLIQLIKRKSLWKVDTDILLLGIYYVLVIFGYLIFEMCPINYRPIRIEDRLEASYPSSTTLLVLSVMPTLCFQLRRRLAATLLRKTVCLLTVLFSLAMVIGRTVCGVHWLTDIVGSVLLSAGLFCFYKAFVLRCDSSTCKEV